MCTTRSYIVTQSDVLSMPKTDSHEEIVKHYHLDDSGVPSFVRCEIVPTKDLEDLASWKFRVDQDTLPDWWHPQEAEIAVREELAKWVASHGWKNLPGYLNLQKCEQLEKLPDQLCTIGGYLDLRGTSIKSLPAGLTSIYGSLDLRGTSIKSLPAGLTTIGGYLDLQGTSIKALPAGLTTIGGYLDLRGTSIKSLPEGLKVAGNIWRD
jgi:hypothetical protein